MNPRRKGVPIIIFGAALRPDGSPSPALVNRVNAALSFGQNSPNALYIPTGAVPQAGRTEADVMSELLKNAGISDGQIIAEQTATDTFDSIVACSKILQKQNIKNQSIMLATSPYHMPRCLLLMKIAGWETKAIPFPYASLQGKTAFQKFYILTHEALACAWDALLVLLWRIVR
ncbi:hypothetical protein AA0313_2174 [Acetobacter indonesiensis NRIC 0313]|uniref:DUF218 domain-containing protein n=1 Tax=Acetobacter indonesiensis TaxID=104101 RepID=A0A252AV06_9PROT|nr:YdcF family protein [Acetobacter indonesiensis]OUI94277.1 hypothetical protein HK17_04390 [Acetobacter indonesiensis]GAN63873.1 hypothetical protein Abin_047_127 [Acetobacter indonesiensis]GBQ59699.1 hypothetical protein AA0313_2174 [Acetobacter indonesiensis NRIC 0313]GEN02690.1 hypothetical protein AIN02nite_07150 [Acetobacter indonesiensis]